MSHFPNPTVDSLFSISLWFPLYQHYFLQNGCQGWAAPWPGHCETGPPPAFRLRDESRRCYKELKRDDMRDREFVGLGNISLSEEEMKNGRVIGVASRCCSDKSRGLCLIMWWSLSVRFVVSTPSNYFSVAFLPKTPAVPRPPHGLLFVSCLMCREDWL